MAREFGMIEESAPALKQLAFQDAVYQSLLLDAAATAAVGQVVQYNTTEDNWDDYTSGMAASVYAVVAEDKTLSGDTKVSCVVKGQVRLAKLDATAQADAEILIALQKSGIIAVADNVRLT